MSRSPFDPSYDQLPEILPVFPLQGVLLLPGGRLPLRIFEPRYLNMFDDALAGPRMIGMVQPSDEETEQGSAAIYRTGCAGRITSFSESEEHHYLLTLSGLIRFGVAEELPLLNGYRRVRPDFAAFAEDLDETGGTVDRARMMTALAAYFEANGIEGDWEAIKQTPDERLVTSLAMVCPFDPAEKQVLLEAKSLEERAETMIKILQMSIHEPEGDTPRH